MTFKIETRRAKLNYMQQRKQLKKKKVFLREENERKKRTLIGWCCYKIATNMLLVDHKGLIAGRVFA